MSGNTEEKARRRAELIVKVRSGLMTATAAAKELGISRNTYYEWERKALKGLMTALADSAPGRPSTPIDSEKESMRRELEATRQELAVLKSRLKIRDELAALPGEEDPGTKKKE